MAPRNRPGTTIEILPASSSTWGGPAEWWAYRDVWLMLALRDIKIRYKQALLGGLWAIFQPVLTLALFAIIFGRVAREEWGCEPYLLYALAGILPWSFFAAVVLGASHHLVDNRTLLTRVYVPRVLIPSSVLGYTLLDFCMGGLLLIPLLIHYQVGLHARLALLPVVFLGVLVLALGLGLWVSALSVRYRDFKYVVPFMLQIGFFATPIFYPATLIPSHWRLLLSANPLSGFLEGFRFALMGTPVEGTHLAWSFVAAFLVLALGLAYFKRVEGQFADIV